MISSIEILGWEPTEKYGPGDFQEVIQLVLPQISGAAKASEKELEVKLRHVVEGRPASLSIEIVDGAIGERQNMILFLKAFGFSVE